MTTRSALLVTAFISSLSSLTANASAAGNGCENNPSSYCHQNSPLNSGSTVQAPSQPSVPGQQCYQGRCYIPHAPLLAAPSAQSAADRLQSELQDVGVERFTAPDYKPGIVKHIVLFRYASSVTAAQKAEAAHQFLALKTLAKRNGQPYIVSIDAGSQISGEGADEGLEQGFIVTFKSQGDRNYYVGSPVVKNPADFDPAHEAFKEFVGPLLDKSGALVFDFSL